MAHELSLEELELQGADLLPARTALQPITITDSAVAIAVVGAQAQNNDALVIFGD
jgi:hypothetical protein